MRNNENMTLIRVGLGSGGKRRLGCSDWCWEGLCCWSPGASPRPLLTVRVTQPRRFHAPTPRSPQPTVDARHWINASSSLPLRLRRPRPTQSPRAPYRPHSRYLFNHTFHQAPDPHLFSLLLYQCFLGPPLNKSRRRVCIWWNLNSDTSFHWGSSSSLAFPYHVPHRSLPSLKDPCPNPGARARSPRVQVREAAPCREASASPVRVLAPRYPRQGRMSKSATHPHLGRVWTADMQQLGLGGTAPAQPGSVGEPAMS